MRRKQTYQMNIYKNNKESRRTEAISKNCDRRNENRPVKRCRVADNLFQNDRLGVGERRGGLVSSSEKCTRKLGIQQGDADKVDELTLDSKRQSTLELRKQQLEIVPSESVTENSHHSCSKQISNVTERDANDVSIYPISIHPVSVRCTAIMNG